MGKDLHYTIIKFFESRMAEHSAVESVQRLKNDDEVIYEIRRSNFRDAVRVWLSDAYKFDDTDFYNRPPEIRDGDYILIAKPEATPRVAYTEGKIRIGKIRDFMGALTRRHMRKYAPRDKG